MLDSVSAVLALRGRLLGASVCTTGSTSLSATTTGYVRASGSFVDDGFAVGMEITTAAGFSEFGNNISSAQGRVITEVTATTLACTGLTAESAGNGKTLTVGLPYQKAWENVAFTPVAGFPFIEEDFVPGTSGMISGPYSGGTFEETGLYVVRVYGLPNHDVLAIRAYTDAIVERFTPGTSMTAGSHTVRVRGDVGPWASQIESDGDGWAVSTITVPYRAYTTNAIA